MLTFKEIWKNRLAAALSALSGSAIRPEQVLAETPPQPEQGDIGFPLFAYAKIFRKSPAQIAQAVAAFLDTQEVEAAGPYINIRLNRAEFAAAILAQSAGETFFRPATLSGMRYMVEFSSPNTNKPLHLGHLRNDVLGESLSRILRAAGAEVRTVCIINDRGVHICKSMLAYKEHGQGRTPESEHIKSDHFVGDFYVRFHKMAQEDAGAEARAQALLRDWEKGEADTTALWRRMNDWAVSGLKETYRRTGISFDQYYFESQTYLKGKDEILRGLEAGIFYRAEDGSVWADLSAEKLDQKALLRKDGTSLYITQDIGTAISRRHDWTFDRLVYVVGSEQQYHFKALFAILHKLGFDWAKNLYHLSYGMVNLPDGKMKSREGTVVDADDLLDSLTELAKQEIRAKNREEAVGNLEQTAEKVALGALHYYLLQVSPAKDMLFDPSESLSFNGKTGPYLQYVGARLSSMLQKAPHYSGSSLPSLLCGDAEWHLLKTVGMYPQALSDAADALDPSLMALYLYDLAKAFSRFYHECPVLTADDPNLGASRLALAQATLQVVKAGLHLICVPFLEAM
ncbi:MAG: arginine--tRNA ligase [Spirochaetaceae bacterium]|jgi:arginyl-tRNA synthetase|nr:arginine--tRNA ligase [Spirochaetaceae bacterium]